MKPQLSHLQLGKLGEDLAGTYLQHAGYQIIGRNFRIQYGELDIIAIDKDTLVFVEVKTRIGDEFGPPEEAVTPRKVREIIHTAEYYVMKHPELPELQRIDVVAIELNVDESVKTLRHIQNITG